MKRILLVLALALVAAVSANAQIKYKDLKAEYNYKTQYDGKSTLSVGLVFPL